MEKCWFVLKPSHYPPPHLPKSGLGTGNGAICLGHIIPHLTNLDDVINRSEEGKEFRPSGEVYHTESWGLDWERDTGLEPGLAASLRALIRAGTPPSAKQQTQLAFERTVKNYKEFDTLDRYIIQAHLKFIGTILRDEAVTARIEQTKSVQLLGLGDSWSVFMITGIIVARGVKGKSGESGIFGAMSSTTTNVADAASIGVTASSANQKNTSRSTETTADFVWAVRFKKIWKDATDKKWKIRTESKGAIASPCFEKPWRDILQSVLSQELFAVGTFQTLNIPDEKGMIVYLNPYTTAERDEISLTTNGCV